MVVRVADTEIDRACREAVAEVTVDFEAVAHIGRPGTGEEAAFLIVDAGIGRRAFLEDAAVVILAREADVGRPLGIGCGADREKRGQKAGFQ